MSWCVNPIFPGEGKIRPSPILFFLHHPKTGQGIKLKLSEFKDTALRHILHVKPVRYVLSCCHGNKITKGTSQNFAPEKSEKSAICKDIELKFGIKTKLGPLSSKLNIHLQFDVTISSLWRFSFQALRWWKHKNDVIVTSYIKIQQILKLKWKHNSRQTLHAICKDIELKFGIKTKLGPLSSKLNIHLQFDVIISSLWRFSFQALRWWKHKNDVIVTSYIKIQQILKLKWKHNSRQTLHAKFYASRIKNKWISRG